VQALVYTFIALAALAVGVMAYFGLTFTPAQSILCSIVFGCVCVVMLERTLRQRAERRLEKAIEDLSRLLATDAQAGAVLGQRINALADLNAGARLESMEADISVLGTVIRQVAEAVADIESNANPNARTGGAEAGHRTSVSLPEPEPTVPIAEVRRALAENRLVFHVQPVVTLPQRRTQGYDLVPRLMLESGELADGADFLPSRGGDEIRRHIEGTGLMEAIARSRQARNGSQSLTLYVPLSRATLGDPVATEQAIAALEANRAIADGLVFVMPAAQWSEMTTSERAVAEAIVRKGASFSLDRVSSLRVDVADLAARGVRSLRIEAGRFLGEPHSFTDFHASDIADYMKRYEVSLLATQVESETQIVELLEDGIVLVQGPHIAAPGPARPDLSVDAPRQLRRAER
jgi:cyclic-di-GMP phosphodiesterase TipF (flagellum assembly factor)